MKKSTMLVGVGVLLIVVALLLMKGKSPSDMPAQESATETENTTQEVTTDDTTTQSRYVTYTPELLQSTSSTRRVLYFYASWCPTCIPADADFQANSAQIPADVTVIRVNYNDPDTDVSEKELAKKYGVTYQHTFVQIDSSGNSVVTWNGGKTDELLAKIK